MHSDGPESVQVSDAAAAAATSGVPTGERRQVTAFFADMGRIHSGFRTARRRGHIRLDPADL